MLILDLWGISFHAVVVFALGKNLLFKSALGHCAYREDAYGCDLAPSFGDLCQSETISEIMSPLKILGLIFAKSTQNPNLP